ESNTTFFANTSININDETSANKKKGKKGVNFLNDHIDFDDIIRQICNQIVKMLYEPKDLYGFGSNDSKVLFIPRIVLKHNSNLVLIQKYSVTPFHKYNFGLFTIAEESNTTFFANTSININDETSANKKKGKKGVNFLNDHIDFDDIIRQIVLKNMFANFFGFIITKEYDHVGLTYVESNRHDKSYPKNYDKIKRRAQNMLNLMYILLYGFKG
ncbi:fam-a protein, partial [Plasmodium berghei]